MTVFSVSHHSHLTHVMQSSIYSVISASLLTVDHPWVEEYENHNSVLT